MIAKQICKRIEFRFKADNVWLKYSAKRHDEAKKILKKINMIPLAQNFSLNFLIYFNDLWKVNKNLNVVIFNFISLINLPKCCI